MRPQGKYITSKKSCIDLGGDVVQVREYFFGMKVMEVLEDFSPIIDHSNLVIKAHSTLGGAN